MEDFCSQSLGGGGTIIDIFGDEHSWSGTSIISRDASSVIDERVSHKAELRNALYNDAYDFDYPIPSEEIGEREKIKIKERLGLEEDLVFEKWRKDKSAPDDIGCFDTLCNEKLKSALAKYKKDK